MAAQLDIMDHIMTVNLYLKNVLQLHSGLNQVIYASQNQEVVQGELTYQDQIVSLMFLVKMVNLGILIVLCVYALTVLNGMVINVCLVQEEKLG